MIEGGGDRNPHRSRGEDVVLLDFARLTRLTPFSCLIPIRGFQHDDVAAARLLDEPAKRIIHQPATTHQHQRAFPVRRLYGGCIASEKVVVVSRGRRA